MNKLERLFKALANRRRLAIIALLHKRKEICVTDVAMKLNLSIKSTSKHLNVLQQVDIVERVKMGLVVFYFLKPFPDPIIKDILHYIPYSHE